MEFDVKKDRNEFCGGSDIPVIMGLSKFKTRYQLLLEKAGLEPDTFDGNVYTEYGKLIEPQIRAYVNQKYKKNYEPFRLIDNDDRCHMDGFDFVSVLEIKSTSTVYKTADEHLDYLVQLLFYLNRTGLNDGMLAVYNRPEDFDPVFDPEKLSEFEIKADEYKPLTEQINAEVSRFKADVARLRANPLLTEEDFQPHELVRLSHEIMELEDQMAKYKTLEDQYKEMKKALYSAMKKHDVKSWQMPNGTKITRVDEIAAKVEKVTEFDVDAFKAEYPEYFDKFQKTVEKKTNGKAGYVRITTG